MILTPIIAVVLAALPVLSQDIVYDAAHNATPIVGTWATGSKAVVTGTGFANPANESFIYPKTTGLSFSFTTDGWYEIARYRFVGNGTEPTCITGVIGWVHGHYKLAANGSILMTPLGDGYQQIQDPCAAVSNFVENYNITERFNSWQIFLDPTDGPKLHLFQYDGSPIAPQFLVSKTPTMLPTKMLRNVTAPITTSSGLTTQGAIALSGGERRWSVREAMGVVSAMFAMGVATLLL